MLVDYHIHSGFSFDSKETMDNICNIVISRGLKEIAITDHLDIYEKKEYSYMLDCESWYQELNNIKEKYKSKLNIKLGIEVGTPQHNPWEYEKFYGKYPLDFIIGSIHNMENDIDVGDYDFNLWDYNAVYKNYNNHLMDLAKNYEFDVMGHLTYPSRYIENQTGIIPDVTKYKEFYVELFKVLKERGKGIELNTSGIARGGTTIMPPLWLIKLYRECGGEIITMGSDAHIAEQVGSTSQISIEFLKEVGFGYYTIFSSHKAEFVKI
ncbi:MAG: histidinol-phosphatase HisJ family protein [Lachnospirales bacterium]